MNIVSPLSVTDRFSQVIEALHALVAAQFRGPALSVAMIQLICGHLRRVERRVLALVAAIRAGTLRVGHARGGRRGPRDAPAEVRPGPKLPRGYAWLVKAVPYKAAALGGWLRVLLQDPEMVALIASTPRLGEMLRPLCRMLAVEVSLATPFVVTGVVLAANETGIGTVDDVAGQRGGAPVRAGNFRAIAQAVAGPQPAPLVDFRFFRA